MSDIISEYNMSQLSQNINLNSALSLNGKEIDDKLFESTFNLAFQNPFSKKEINTENFDETSIYLDKIINLKKSISKKSTNQSLIFISKEKTELKEKKIGRKKKENTSVDNKNSHDRNSPDNILRRVQNHFINFIIFFINDILKELNYTEHLIKIDYALKKNITKEYVESLKTKKISDIVCFDISRQYSTKSIDANRIVYYKIKENEILNKLFNTTYMEFFDIYYKSQSKYINLKIFGLDKEIKISDKTKIFLDLSKNESDKYIKNLKICISQNYLNNKFLVL